MVAKPGHGLTGKGRSALRPGDAHGTPETGLGSLPPTRKERQFAFQKAEARVGPGLSVAPRSGIRLGEGGACLVELLRCRMEPGQEPEIVWKPQPGADRAE